MVNVFARDSADGSLTHVEAFEDGQDGITSLAGARWVTVSPDGNHVYVAAAVDRAVTVFSRDPATGRLTEEQIVQHGVDGIDTLYGAFSVLVSPDGLHVYVVGHYSNAVSLFARDTITGELMFVEAIKHGQPGIEGLYRVAFVFSEPAGGWSGILTPSATLRQSDGGADESFGVSVAVDGDTIVVGASHHTNIAHPEGSAYVFTQPAGGWSGERTEASWLAAPDALPRDGLGYAVSISGGTIAAGSPYRDDGGIADQVAAK
jgi:DNA-binding beta-propeller fold protein YncE